MPIEPQRHVFRQGQPASAKPRHLSDVFTRPAGSSLPAASPKPFETPLAPRRRDRIWELSINLHCSIIGTCLSTADLRALLTKLGDQRAQTASEHDLHGQAVNRAGRKNEGGKLLHKLLDRRHAREVARFERADDRDTLRALWADAVSQGRIPGAYWAVLTHPFADHALVQEAFGEVHMLSHLVGRSVRADLRRIVELDAQVDAQADVIAEQASRIRALTDERTMLMDALAAARSTAPANTDHPRDGDGPHERDALVSRLREQFGRAEAHAAAERDRRAEAERLVRALAEDVRQGAAREQTLRTERDSLEVAFAAGVDQDGECGDRSLEGRTLLYVGGRPRQVAQARLFARQQGGDLLSHDGGVEDNPLLLPGLVARASAVFFPVDCVSHDAAQALKRACRDKDVPFVPLRSASLAALVTAAAAVP